MSPFNDKIPVGILANDTTLGNWKNITTPNTQYTPIYRL
jgi:hypothetical protein